MPEPLFDYEACLLACARGEQHALRQLYEQDCARLLGVAKRIARDTALAEDIVHEAFINIWNGAGGFDPRRGSARGWVYSVTRHMALNVMRKSQREVALSDEHERTLVAEPTAEHFEYRARSGKVYQCLEHLEPSRRSCLLHAYVDGLSHSEIAQKLDTPLGTVKAWIKRSLAALRECMA